MISDNPYASPNTTNEKPRSKELPIQYRSRKQAIVAGLRRGAVFGGKLAAVICIAFSIVMGILLYETNHYTGRTDELFTKIMLVGFIDVVGISVGAVVGALMLGHKEAILYKDSTDNDKREEA